MIVTFTANPSIDKTISLSGPLQRGEVQRAVAVTVQPGGKGINVARCLQYAGESAVAVLAVTDEAFNAELDAVGVQGAYRVSQDGLRVRTNTALTETDGTTTKINEPGPTLSQEQVQAAQDELVQRAATASWTILSGSLPPGAPVDWYARLVAALHPLGCKVAVDTSDAALEAVLAALPGSPGRAGSFDLIKPNSDELAQLTGGDATAFEAAAAAGDVQEIVAAARALQRRGIANVLVTLGGAGAVLVNDEGAWVTTAPGVDVKSTVGAGDSAVAGFVLASVLGEPPDRCLATAAAYGSAAAGLPGTTLPRPADVHTDEAVVSRVDDLHPSTH